jgi:hypothetical protein
MTPLSSDRKKSDKTFIDTIWLQLKLMQVMGLLPLQVSGKGFKSDKFWEIYYLIFFCFLMIYNIYSHLTFDKEHLKHHNPIIIQMTLSQFRVLSVIAFITGISHFRRKKIFVEFLTKAQQISQKLNQLEIEIPYRKIGLKLWLNASLMWGLNVFLAVGVCAAIHPYYGEFLQQLRCRLVS